MHGIASSGLSNYWPLITLRQRLEVTHLHQDLLMGCV